MIYNIMIHAIVYDTIQYTLHSILTFLSLQLHACIIAIDIYLRGSFIEHMALQIK